MTPQANHRLSQMLKRERYKTSAMRYDALKTVQLHNTLIAALVCGIVLTTLIAGIYTMIKLLT